MHSSTPAARFPGKVSERIKKERLQKLLDLQQHCTLQKNKALVGSTEVILVEGVSKKQSRTGMQTNHRAVQWTGRTSSNKIVNFIQGDDSVGRDEIRPGRLVTVRIEEAFPHSLWGKPVCAEPIPFGLKGEESYAA